jgi:DNA-binding protein HU-beta
MDKLTKSQVLSAIADGTGLPRSTVNDVVNGLFEVIGDELAKGNEINFTGQLKFGFRVTKAIKKGTLVRKPASGHTWVWVRS